jgi:F-type H+-transporting ATPase subunit c
MQVGERGSEMKRITAGLFMVGVWLLANPTLAMAAEEGGGGAWWRGLIALAAGLGLGIAAFGAALGQGRATAAAMESIGRNPNSADRVFTPLIVGLALMEALALYAFVIAIILQGKVPTP